MVTKFHHLRLTSILSLTGLAASFASANEADDRSAPELPTTMVSAPRFMDVDMEVAARVELIDAAAIADSGATNVVELLSREANLHFRSTSSNSAQSEVSIGGFGEASSQRVLVILDGHRLNTADLGQLNWLSIPLSLVESIEVVKGGQSALYGNNAVGGVIKITTKQPTEDFQGQAQASVGSHDSYNARIGVSGAAGPIKFSAHAQHDETDGYRDNSQFESDAAGVNLGWDFDDWLSAHVSVSHVDSEYGLPGSLSRAELDADRTQSNAFADFGEEEATYYRGGLQFELSEELSLSIDAGYTERELFTVFYFYGFGPPAFPFNIEQDYSIFSISPVLTYQNERTTASFGVDYYDDEVAARFGADPVDYERQTVAAFASIKHALNDDWIATASLRFEEAKTDGEYTAGGVLNKLNELSDQQHAWSLGLIRSFEDRGRAYASVRRFYRYPATDEVTLVDFMLKTASFNPDLDPEYGHEAELGADWAFESFQIGGRVYRQWMHDEIVFDPGAFANTNLDETSRYGFDLNATWFINDNLDASLQYAWVHAEIDGGTYNGSAVPLVPEHKVRLQVEYRPRESITLSAGATYTHDNHLGGDFANAKSELADYILVDLSARFRICENVEIFANIDNLFDKEYVSTGFAGKVDAFYPSAGRSARIGLLWTF